ncbi:hypothetical protein GJU41_00130 [Bacillus idriensis]|uniref:Uncharacterized protein n=1 Tax=Metabacillus idriensis TaxID=324768 RepID=A0A6I2M4P5_9BACI|nr:hypothetical protein [Metabacillus idriensis]MRX52362.1 hypothetical protein [Metabacillus idriensis]
MNYSKFANLSPETIMKDEKLREEFYEYLKGRMEVLERVKTILLFPSDETANTQQVAWFYQVDKKVIEKVVFRNLNELAEDGYTNGIFTSRAILRIGMLLDDNEIANEVMDQLFNISQK